MKKIFILIVLLLGLVLPIMAQNKALDKRENQEIQSLINHLNADGWKLCDPTRSLEEALRQHKEKLSSDEDLFELTGECSDFVIDKSSRSESFFLANLVCKYYALLQLSCIIRGDGSDDDKSVSLQDESKINVLSDDIEESFSLIRKEDDNGTFSMQSFFTINKKSISPFREFEHNYVPRGYCRILYNVNPFEYNVNPFGDVTSILRCHSMVVEITEVLSDFGMEDN